MRYRWAMRWGSAATAALMLLALAIAMPLLRANAEVAQGMPAGASCAVLAAHDQSATNGQQWGRTLLAGHGAPGGWFGVDVCGNGVNSVAPGGANVSCDRVPTNFNATGCAPGGATSDGFGLTFQCVELVQRFAAWAFGDRPDSWHGNAPDLWLGGHHPTDFVPVPNGASRPPVPGDIVVWGATDWKGNPWPTGPQGWHDGHTAVVAAVEANRVTIVEENALWGSRNIPSETVALSHVDGMWLLSSSRHPLTHLPAAGAGRALYGWLHSRKNTGRFGHSGAVGGAEGRAVGSAPATPVRGTPHTTTGPTTSAGLPSLAPVAVVTAGGTLADLTWSTPGAESNPLDAATAPGATARDLGAPAAGPLAIDETPAVVSLASGGRYVFARGQDGKLYSAFTAPTLFGVDWSALDAPPGVALMGTVSATSFADGVAVVAQGNDGKLWWRAGPAGNLGGWIALGRPPGGVAAGAIAIAGMPGAGSPLVLALNAHGQLYENDWLDSQPTNPNAPPGWVGWMAVTLPATVTSLTGSFLVATEIPARQSSIGKWSDVPLDVVARDSAGHLWWLRRTGATSPWLTRPVDAAHAGLTPLALTAVASPATLETPDVARLHLYAADAAGVILGNLRLTGASARAPTTWSRVTSLSPLWATTAAVHASAVALGPDLSALVAPHGGRVLIAGRPDALTQVAPTSSGAPGRSAVGTWTSTGAIPGSQAFDDVFAVSDARWLVTGSSIAPTRITGGALLLAPGAVPARMLQALGSGDGAIQARLRIPAGAAGTVVAGVMLYLDDGDSLALGVNAAGAVSLCPVAWNQARACLRGRLASVAAVRTGISLRISRTGDVFTGAASADGMIWQTVGVWQPPAPTVASGATTTGATPPATTPSATPTGTATQAGAQATSALTVAPLAFTAAGLFAVDTAPAGAASTTGIPSAATSPAFLSFTGFTTVPSAPTAKASATPAATTTPTATAGATP